MTQRSPRDTLQHAGAWRYKVSNWISMMMEAMSPSMINSIQNRWSCLGSRCRFRKWVQSGGSPAYLLRNDVMAAAHGQRAGYLLMNQTLSHLFRCPLQRNITNISASCMGLAAALSIAGEVWSNLTGKHPGGSPAGTKGPTGSHVNTYTIKKNTNFFTIVHFLGI